MSVIEGLRQVRLHDLAIEARKEGQIVRALRSGRPLASYIGWTGQGNLGDEVLYDAHVAMFPAMSIVPFRPDVTVRIARAVRPRLPGFVAGFLGGGTLINQSEVWLRRIRALQSRGLHVACMGGGVTPPEFQHSFERTSLREWVPVLRSLTFLGVRGPLSQRLLSEAGLDAPITGDPALALTPAVAPPYQETGVVGINIGVSSKTLMYGDPAAYLTAMSATVRELVAMGLTVRLLPVCAADMPSNEHVLAEVSSPACSLVSAYDDLSAYNAELQQCSAFVGEKLHATILATMQRVPSLMLAYQPKCEDYMASIGQERNCVRTDAIHATDIARRISALLESSTQARRDLDSQVLRLCDAQRAAAAVVTARFAEGESP